MHFQSRNLFAAALAATAVSGKLNWGSTKFLFTFGDSYTTDGFNITAGVDSPVPGFVRVSLNIDESISTLTRFITIRHLQMDLIG
jgi:hypothetical protein